jgi:hypothetical protein
VLLPAFAYWYDGGRPSGCCCGFMGREVDEAEADRFGGAEAAAGAGCVDEAEVEVVLAALEADVPFVPLVLAGGCGGGGGDRFWVLAEFCEATELLLDRRVEPTSFLKRAFISYSAAARRA